MADGKILGVPRKPALIIGAAGAAFLAYMWYRNGQATDPVEYVDPNDVGETEYESPLGSSGTNSTGSYDNTDPDAIDTNAKWTQAATDSLEAAGWDRGAVLLALGKWLSFQGLTANEISIVTAARGVQGDPPVGGPYPMKDGLPSGGTGTVPATPTGLKVLSKSRSTVRLGWDAVPGATSYQIRWLSSMTFSTDNAETIMGLPPGKDVRFYVSGRNASGQGNDAVLTVTLPKK